MNADGAAGAGRPTVRDLNALLGSRICHDLISPLGAIGNGVELLSMSGLSAAPELALISESVEHANARIRLFRIAYGSASPGATVPRTEVLDIVTCLSRGGRLRFEWQVQGDLPRAFVKVAFLALQCFETEMPFGGTVKIQKDQQAWVIEGKAERKRANSPLWVLLHDPGNPTEVSPSDVHFALLPIAADAARVSLHLEFYDDAIRLTLDPRAGQLG